METTEKWGRRIRAFRKLKGYTQESLAKELLVSVSILGEIERGNRMPSEEMIDSIVGVLKITREELDPHQNK
ncbi:helix-turn-helix transcriptional regulator [Cytobacillus oceanisediminis]|jgi:transcriptional regulator with XRE-family HTH domain|uniref:Helix-turn-helix transcriptional regulator n=2 Tax=Niallia TaxID=2837506 RepID=A0A941GKC5_NIACI|nr:MULTISPECIES: helix-turn-helix transcriptional regulator [Bacillaceae]EOR21812.1 helix-turn-helix domain-containing protein [Niallia nealsonii AAU1]MDU1847488.1 helix-turn-helix transcriptional regulator [Niallia nealsonii]MBZ9535199.1 helix-turn-helix transcriptional regulator [Cytobacillus oceanisediminis]MCB5239517.1 helix-turn-helix domain-containing protein [Niallia circulans]MED3794787.1 helix-turn-helix transcriptional regulator [Niallia alba]